MTVGGAHKRGHGTPKWYRGRFFGGGHSYFLSVSNDFSGKKRDLKSVVHCPCKYIFSALVVMANKNVDFRLFYKNEEKKSKPVFRITKLRVRGKVDRSSQLQYVWLHTIPNHNPLLKHI